MTAITLTNDQQNALDAINQFLIDPIETVFVLSGYSGTGKSTLVKTLLDKLPGFMQVAKLINAKLPTYEVVLTATTNKAAEALAYATGDVVSTIHSYLGLRVQTDFKTNTSTLVPTSSVQKEGILLFIDEASYIDPKLLKWIFSLTCKCKIVFMGDPAQLTPVMSSSTPVFAANFKGAHLTQVVRQAEGNPIIQLSTQFRETVNTGEFFSFVPDGKHIQYMDRATFNKSVEQEFTRKDWKYQDSKVLAWTNKCVVAFNHAISDKLNGDPSFQVGDYAVCNKYVTVGRKSIKTDQLVCITHIGEDIYEHNVLGNVVIVDHSMHLFLPKSLADKKALIKSARAANDLMLVERVENGWIDLRAAYACTVNKAQGSTYDAVYIDLDDISRCNSGDQIARMMYVAVSRARDRVYLTGDLV